MKKLFILAILLAVAAFSGCLAFAQDAPLPDLGTPNPELGTPVVTDDGGITFTQVMAILVAVVFAARLIVKLTPTPKDDSVLEKIVNFLKHIGLNVKSVLLIGALTVVSGCGGVVQVKPGSDPIVVVAEWTAENSLNAIDSFLAFERANEAELLKRSQAIHAAADHLREVAPTEIKNLRSLTRQYKWDKTAANGDQVVAATKALLALANSVRGHMGLPPLVPPASTPSATDLMRTAPTNGPPPSSKNFLRDSSVAERAAHNREAVGAIPTPAASFFSYHIHKEKQPPRRTATPIEALKTSNLQKSDYVPRRSVAGIRQIFHPCSSVSIRG